MRSPLDTVMLGGGQSQMRFSGKEIAGKPVSFHSFGILGLFFFWIRKLIALLKRKSTKSVHQEYGLNEHALWLLPEDRLPLITHAPNRHVADIRVRFLGKLEIEYRGKLLEELHGVKIASLLAYLLYHHQKTLLGEILKSKFWGNSCPESARNSLHVALHKIRKLFQTVNPEEQVLLHDFASYRINPNLTVLSDTDEFVAHWRKGRAIEHTAGLEAALPCYNQASALYRGDFLENIMLEEWCESERDNLKETYLFILNRLSDYFFQQKSYTASVNVCRKILAKDPCIEETHQRLIICYQNLGMRDKAIRQFYLCEETLKKELSVRPSDYTRSLFQAISQA